jgi:hypothetical protein
LRWATALPSSSTARSVAPPPSSAHHPWLWFKPSSTVSRSIHTDTTHLSTLELRELQHLRSVPCSGTNRGCYGSQELAVLGLAGDSLSVKASYPIDEATALAISPCGKRPSTTSIPQRTRLQLEAWVIQSASLVLTRCAAV